MVKRILITLLCLSLIISVCAFVFFPLPGYVPVLMYHFLYPKSEVVPEASSLNVATEDFQKQMWFLKTFGFRPISLDEYYEIKTGLRKPQGREVVITFDDGHHSYLDRALPVLEQYQFKSVNFLVWKWLTGDQKDYIHLSEAKNLSGNPLVDLQSHTVNHPNLAQISLSEAKTEITQSKIDLENALGRKIKYLCYPEGSFTPEIMKLAEQAGYQLAFRTSLKFYKSYPETPYSIVRIKVSPKYNLFVFWWYVSGMGHYAKEIDHFFHRLTLAMTGGTLTPYKPSLTAT